MLRRWRPFTFTGGSNLTPEAGRARTASGDKVAMNGGGKLACDARQQLR